MFAPLAIGAPAGQAVTGDPVIKTGTPESEIRRLHAELEQTAQAMRSLPRVAGQPVIGPRKIASERAWRAAQLFEENGDRVSNIRELTRYLNLVQTGESQRYLVAQRQLAFNYEKVRMPDKAMRAALRYAGSFISQTPSTANYEDFVEVLRLVSRLMKTSGPEARAELRQLFAAFTSVDMPAEAKMNVLVLAARAAGSTGDLEMARKFLRDPALQGAPQPLDGEVLYLGGIIHAADGKLDAAMSSLKAAIATFGAKHADKRDRARLALARVQVRKGQNDLAAATYSSIDELSPVYQDALFESVYVLIDLGRVNDARDQAAIFKKQFGSTDAASKMKLSRMDGWLAMQAGDWDGARKAIESQRAVYKEIVDFTSMELAGARPVESPVVDRIYMKHAGLMDVPDEIEQSWQIARKLEKQEDSLAMDRGEIRQLFMSLGRASLAQINPSWVNTTRALDALVKRHLEAGHRLVGLERNLLLQRLTPAERQELVASENRRNALLGRYPQTLARSEGWRNTADLLESTIRLSAVNDRLMGVESGVSGIRYLEHLGDIRGKDEGSAPGFTGQVNGLRKKLYRTLELVRAQQVENLAETGNHRQLRRLMAFYSMALFDEESVLRRARNEVSDTAERMLFEDFERTWRLWQQVAKDSYQQLVTLDKTIRDDLGKTVGELWQQDRGMAKAAGEILSVRNRMALWVGSRRGAIIDTVKQRVGDRFERLDQWSADIDAMRSDTVRDAARKEALRFDAARQSARDEVVNSQVGGAAAWLD